MREIPVSRITDVVERLCIEANTHLPGDVKCAIEACRACEDGDIAVGVLDNIIENYHIADRECVPICQDTGMACVFLEIGQDVHLTGGDLREAVDEGVVRDPVRRGNTGDNTPAVLYTEIVPGEQVKITLGPKGFGSENMSAIRMFKPSAGLQGIKDFILETVEAAGPNPCPPIVVGVGIGGTFDKAALLAKKALMRRSLLCRSGKGNAGKGERSRHRPPGLRRQNHRHRPEHRDHAHPYRGNALRHQHQLPCDPAQNGGAVTWKRKSPSP